MPTCPDCGMSWGGFPEVPTVCLTCACVRASGQPAAPQRTPWDKPQPGAPPPLRQPTVAEAIGKLGEAMRQAAQATQPLAAAFAAIGDAVKSPPPPQAHSPNVWIASGTVQAASESDWRDVPPARLCTCDHWEDDHDRLGCTDCGTCDAFVLHAAATAIEETGSLDPRDFPLSQHVRLKNGRRVEMADVTSAAAVLSRRAKASAPPPPLEHRRGIRLRGIRQKKEGKA